MHSHLLLHLVFTQGPQLMVWAVSLSTTKLISRSLTAKLILIGIRSLIGFGKLVGPLVHSVLYLRQQYLTLYLNIFRGEPDISEFDQPFTPIPTSSKHVVRYNGSVLHLVLPKLQPGQGQITRFRVYSQQLKRPIKTRFRCGSVFNLTLPLKITRWLIMQKARCHSCRKRRRAPTASRCKVSGSISLLFSRFFSPFPHGTGSLSVSREYLALDDGPPGFKQDFSCPALLRESSWYRNFFDYRTVTFFGRIFQTVRLKFLHTFEAPTTPTSEKVGLG